MGVVRLLCITILFAACLVAAQDCSGQGHKNGNGDCVCNSGFSDAACATQFSACSTFQKSSNIKADRHPTLDVDVNKISFTANTLKLSIVSELVPNRTYTNIAFVPQSASPSDAIAAKCNLLADNTGASLWAQHSQTSGSFCRDEFQFTMFWGDWKGCGFAEQGSSADYWVYKTRFVIYYTDDVGAPYAYDADTTANPEMYRKSSVSYTVYTRFLKVKTLENYLDISVNNTVAYKVAITRFDYDPSSMNLTMGISTMVWWPNRMDRTTMLLAKTDPLAVTGWTIQNSGMPVSESTNVNDEATNCQVNSGNCLQYYEFIIHLDSGCDFNGDYIIYGVADTCRDIAQNCTKGYQTAHIDVRTSDVCGTVTAEPTVEGQLTSYDVARNPQSEFIVGTRGYFEVEMTSQQNAFNLTWIDIWVVADEDVVAGSGNFNDRNLLNIQWLFKDGVIQTAGFKDLTDRTNPGVYGDFNTVFGTHTQLEPTGPCDLEVNTDASNLSKNSNSAEVVYTPHFNFRFDSRIFPVPLNKGGLGLKTVGYTLHARGHIVYAGNEKYGRTEETVDFVWSTDAAGFDGKVKFALAQPTSASEVANNNSNTALVASLAPVAGIALVVVAAAVVAAVIIKRRKSTSTFATLN